MTYLMLAGCLFQSVKIKVRAIVLTKFIIGLHELKNKVFLCKKNEIRKEGKVHEEDNTQKKTILYNGYFYQLKIELCSSCM